MRARSANRKQRRLTGTRRTRKQAEVLLTELLGQIDKDRVNRSKATVAELLERWLETADHEFTTRTGYQRYIGTKILPALGVVEKALQVGVGRATLRPGAGPPRLRRLRGAAAPFAVVALGAGPQAGLGAARDP